MELKAFSQNRALG